MRRLQPRDKAQINIPAMYAYIWHMELALSLHRPALADETDQKMHSDRRRYAESDAMEVENSAHTK